MGIHIDSITICEALTRLGGCHTRVRWRVQPPTRLPMRRCCVWVFFFFWIHADSAPICADSASIRAEPDRFGQNWVVSAGGRNWPKRPKLIEMAEIGLESCIALAKNWNLSLTVELKPTTEFRESHIHQHHRNPQQHNCYSVGLWQSELQYKRTLITPKCPLLCILLDRLVAPKVMWLFWSFYLDVTRCGWDGYTWQILSAWSDIVDTWHD